MAASNLLEKLDKALLRPGRFDRQVFVPPPDMHGREQILEVHSKGKPLAQDIDLERVARHAAGLTGADLANLVNEAAILAGRKQRDFVAQADFENAFERVIAGLQTRKVITDHEKRVVAWHEAGPRPGLRAAPTVDKVQKVSIVPRGKALGYTLNLPQEDRYLKSRQELIDYMKVLLAGRVAEQITFGRVTTGASDDLEARHHDRPLDGLRVRDGDHDPFPSGSRDDFNGVRVAAPDAATRRCSEIAEESYRGATPADHRPPGPARRDRRARSSTTR